MNTSHTAGIFQGPPALERAIFEWARSVYAGHVWAYCNEKLPIFQDRIPQIQKMKSDIEAAKRGVAAAIDKLKPGATIKFEAPYIYSSYEQSFYVAVKKDPDFATYCRVGYGERTPKFKSTMVSLEDAVKQVTTAMDSSIRMAEDAIQDPMMRQRTDTDDMWLVNLALLRTACKKYAQAPKSYSSKTTTTIPIDLAGWKYLDVFIRETNKSGQQVTRETVAGYLRAKNFESLSAVLHFKGHAGRGGQWNESTRTLEIDVPIDDTPNTVQVFEAVIESLATTTRHEVQHVGQSLLTAVAQEVKAWGAGLPSPSLRQDGYDVYGDPTQAPGKGRLDHELRDIEFHTDLADAVDAFVQLVRPIPTELRADFLRAYVGLSFDTSKFKSAPYQNKHFLGWKKKSPGK